jgi:outer membrane receptor protein involved in Fe transport
VILLVLMNRKWIFLFCLGLCLWGMAIRPLHAQSRVAGQVKDATGAPIAGATVKLKVGGYSASTSTDSSGNFSFLRVPAGSGYLEVSEEGFSVSRIPLEERRPEMAITLLPSTVHEQVIVSATRTEARVSEVPGSTVRLSTTDLAATPALALDDMLRQIPGFTLFRRTGSRFANPTSQGVSLRGLGASGASRALVLEDGIPLLDPFGGWVYWDRLPPTAVADVEVFRGGVSNLYGSSAMGGVVQFVTRQPDTPRLVLESSYGNENTPHLSLWSGARIGGWDLQGSTDLFRTDGYVAVPLDQRGLVDTPVNSEHGTLDFGLGHQWGNNGRVFARGNLFEESRDNGTPVQTNDTHMASAALGVDKQLSTSDSILARVYGDFESYNQNFSSIAADRSSESLSDMQHVPAQGIGAQLQWMHAWGKHQTIVAGGDADENLGASEEQIFNSGTHIANSVSAGRQRTVGFFGEDIIHIEQWTIIPGARLDDWRNLNGLAERTTLSSGFQKITGYADRSENAFSPKLSVLRPLTQNISVTASVYRAFRAPSLNELYRSFRVGNVVTQNNATLRAERLTGAEAGVNVTGFDRKLDVRGTFFWSDIVNPIANVTLTTTPTLITRQRQNLGRTRSRGVELDGTAHVTAHIDISGGYAYTDATVVQFPANTSLIGLNLPQTPRNQFTLEARYWSPSSLMLSVQGRFVGQQFDDDQNLLPLGRYFVVDFMVAHSLPKGLTGFVSVENALDEAYTVGRTPVPTLGPPILFRIGLRYGYGERSK